ncbi:MAG: hypothetical protein IKZ10_05365 [Akkermansia sp.]|nr:hypothetical protein [Akkermansia sp.]
MKTLYNGYRMITLLVPLHPHDTEQDRCRNVKLSGVLRWYLYSHFQGDYYLLKPQADSRLKHGALCISAKRRCKFEEKSVRESLALEQLLGYLRRENLCPYIQVLDDGGVGEPHALPPIGVNACAAQSTPILPDATALHRGPSMEPAHIPYFARQVLLLMRDKPVAQCKLTEESYKRLFHMPSPLSTGH